MRKQTSLYLLQQSPHRLPQNEDAPFRLPFIPLPWGFSHLSSSQLLLSRGPLPGFPLLLRLMRTGPPSPPPGDGRHLLLIRHLTTVVWSSSLEATPLFIPPARDPHALTFGATASWKPPPLPATSLEVKLPDGSRVTAELDLSPDGGTAPPLLPVQVEWARMAGGASRAKRRRLRL